MSGQERMARTVAEVVPLVVAVAFLVGLAAATVNGNVALAVVCAAMAALAGAVRFVVRRPWLSDW